MPEKTRLNPEDILRAEYDYIANTVFQANEDRARVSSFYFISVGSLVAAILGTQFAADNLRGVAVPFALLFAVMTALGALTLAQLARLRAAWHESVEAMNQIKGFYLRHHPELEPAFKWRGGSIPPTDKPNSIANLIALEVRLLASLTCAAGLYFLLLAFGALHWWSWALVAASFLAAHLWLWKYYKGLLVDDR